MVPLRQAALAFALCSSACFDSDDKFRVAPEATTTGVPATTTDPSTSTGEPPASSSGDAEVTCRDLIACVAQCVVLLDASDPEPDFSCIIDCTEDPRSSPEEVYNLLNLIDCLTGICEAEGECMPPMVTSSTSSGSDSGSDTGSSSSSSSSSSTTGMPDPGLIPECLACLLAKVAVPEPSECPEFHQMCM